VTRTRKCPERIGGFLMWCSGRTRKAGGPTAAGVYAAPTELRYCMGRIHELDA